MSETKRTDPPITGAVVDPSSGAQILRRICIQLEYMIDISSLAPEKKMKCKNLLAIIAVKFIGIWSLRAAYLEKEAKMEAEGRANPIPFSKTEPTPLSGFQDLYINFDLFCVEVKSILDHMVHFVHHGLDLSAGSFRDDGNPLLSDLRQVGPKSPLIKQRVAKRLAELIAGNQPWLATLIRIRDRMNHSTKLPLEPMTFMVVAIRGEDGALDVRLPMVDGKRVSEILNLITDNSLLFVEAFIGIALCPKISRVAVGMRWTGQMSENQFIFMDWPSVDRAAAAGHLQPEHLMTVRDETLAMQPEEVPPPGPLLIAAGAVLAIGGNPPDATTNATDPLQPGPTAGNF